MTNRWTSNDISIIDVSHFWDTLFMHMHTHESKSLETSLDFIIRVHYVQQSNLVLHLLFDFAFTLGTILSGFCIFCCGRPRVHTKEDPVLLTFCVNVAVGLMQLFTVSFMMVGWFWSVVWGIYMIILAGQRSLEKELPKDYDEDFEVWVLTIKPWHLNSTRVGCTAMQTSWEIHLQLVHGVLANSQCFPHAQYYKTEHWSQRWAESLSKQAVLCMCAWLFSCIFFHSIHLFLFHFSLFVHGCCATCSAFILDQFSQPIICASDWLLHCIQTPYLCHHACLLKSYENYLHCNSSGYGVCRYAWHDTLKALFTCTCTCTFISESSWSQVLCAMHFPVWRSKGSWLSGDPEY